MSWLGSAYRAEIALCCLLTAPVSCCVFLSLQYGPPGRSPTDATNRECVACTQQSTGYSFEWNMENDMVSVPAISKTMASSSVDCLAKYTQTVDGAWWVPLPNFAGLAVFGI